VIEVEREDALASLSQVVREQGRDGGLANVALLV